MNETINEGFVRELPTEPLAYRLYPIFGILLVVFLFGYMCFLDFCHPAAAGFHQRMLLWELTRVPPGERAANVRELCELEEMTVIEDVKKETGGKLEKG